MDSFRIFEVCTGRRGLIDSLHTAAICSLLCAASLRAGDGDPVKAGNNEKPPVSPADSVPSPEKNATSAPVGRDTAKPPGTENPSAPAPASITAPAPTLPAPAKPPEVPFTIRQPGDLVHWYDKLMVILDEKPAAGELTNVLAPRRKDVENATEAMIAGIKKAVTDKGILGDRWTIVTLTCAKHGGDLMLTAHVGLAKLYTKVPSIAFSGTLLDHCVGKLARDSGIQVAQSAQAYNPRITFNKSDISPSEALESILQAHGFRYKYSGVIESTNVRVQDFLTEAEMVDAMGLSIEAKIKILNAARPGILFTPKGAVELPGKPSATATNPSVPAPAPTQRTATPPVTPSAQTPKTPDAAPANPEK